MNLWDEVLAKVEAKVNRHSFATWLRPTTFHALQGSSLLVRVPNPQFKDWLARNYHGIIAESLHDLGRAEVHVVFECEPGSAAAPEAGSDREAVAVSTALNPKYTFESFVVGSSNQFAHAAARAVAEIPSKSYNPLFIYGGVGLGKTHLMHAIGHYIQARNRQLQLTYISSDRFINEMINAIRFDRLQAFRQKYRNTDVLLVDDIQFIAGKDRTQEEFFHIFNALHDGQKQLVISSDCPPRQIPTLEERLHSRFEWGLIVDIQAPDLETKVAIIKKKAERQNIAIPDNVALYIASKIKSNIRELEGALVRLIAYCSLTGSEITLVMAQETLHDIFAPGEKAVTIEMIQKTIADHFGMRVQELKSKNNSKSVAIPRQICMYLCKRLTGMSLPHIGREFGNKHHTTVLHSINKIELLRQQDRELSKQIQRFIDSFT